MAKVKRGLIYLALVHYPVYNKHKKIVVTAVTNYDIHDISRASATFNLDGYFIVTPLESQQKLSRRIIDYWREGPGKELNYTRNESLLRTDIADSIEAVVSKIEKIHGKRPLLVGTSARLTRKNKRFIDFSDVERIARKNPILLLFGTGWGMDKRIIKECDHLLPPIKGPSEYNHLSVRSAVSIILDRIRGR